MGSITSRADYSVKFSVVTPELRASESGELIRLHGKAVSVLITPLDGADADVVEVTPKPSARRHRNGCAHACMYGGSNSERMDRSATFMTTRWKS